MDGHGQSGRSWSKWTIKNASTLIHLISLKSGIILTVSIVQLKQWSLYRVDKSFYATNPKLCLTDCFVKNKCTTSRAPIISNETKLKSIFISVLVDSLDILGFE